MTFWRLIRRSLRFHARAHLGVLLGAAIGSAALIGALVVGDSVKGTLRDRALARLGLIHFALYTPDRVFNADLARRLTNAPAPGSGPSALPGKAVSVSGQIPLSALLLPGIVSRPDGSARVNRVTVLGVDEPGWPRVAGWGTLFPPAELPGGTNDEAAGPQVRLREGPLTAWQRGEAALINEELARRLGARAGDEIIVRVQKPSQLGLDAAISPRDQDSTALRLKVAGVLGPENLGDFSLLPHQVPPANLFLPLTFLARQLGVSNQANLVVAVDDAQGLASIDSQLQNAWLPENAGLSVRSLEQPPAATGGEYIRPSIEISSSRIFLQPSVVAAALKPSTKLVVNHAGFENDSTNEIAMSSLVTNGCRVLTYLANLIRSGQRSTPYSMVTAADAPYVPAGMRDDEILVSQWLADDLQVKPGDTVELSYFVVDSGSRLTERTNSFRVRGVVPLKGIYADRTLMPEFPGLAKAESTQDWDGGFPLVYPIRQKDEQYWRTYRGTPKAFVNLAAGQKMWANRFGSLTAVRYQVPANSSPSVCRDAVRKNLVANLEPGELGLRFEPVRRQALSAADQSQDFGQLFLGFSFFLVVSALLLMVLLFRFGLEQRVTETGTLLALGFRPAQVRRLLLGEGIVLAAAGGVLGAIGGLFYAKAMLWALTTIWRSAVNASVLEFHASAATLATGFVTSTVVAVLTIWFALRKTARQPVAALLAGAPAFLPAVSRSRGQRKPGFLSAVWLGVACLAGALAIVVWGFAAGDLANAGAFFGAGALLLVSGLLLASAFLGALARRVSPAEFTRARLAVSGSARRRSRSVATIALLASGSFVVAALGIFRLEASRDAWLRSSGTGGFALIGDSSLPVVYDLNTRAGREARGLSEADLAGAHFVSFRVHQGDDASCLNLNHAHRPRLLGVDPGSLAGRFTFAAVAKGLDRQTGWELLSTRTNSVSLSPSGEEGRGDEAVIPAIGDANSIEWALGKKLGDTIDYTDERGRAFKVRLVGAVANSILQGSLIIDEAEFVKRFPNESGYRFFLIDAPTNSAAKLAATLSRSLQDQGFEVTPAVGRLNALNAVQNTYLGTFQILGGLGLLLGSAGLGVVVLRNVLERRAELGLFLAVGFRRRTLYWLLFREHAVLLAAGLGLGVASAAVAVLPSVIAPGAQLPSVSVGLTLAAVGLSGLLWTLLATRLSMRGNLLDALRNE